MRVVRISFIVLLLVSILSANTSLLNFTTSPYSASIGNSSDLLDLDTPFSRSYSGAFANKNKSEIVFYHTSVPDDVIVENVLLGLENEWIKGMRFGAYVAFENIGEFNLFENGEIKLSTIRANSFLVGIPIIFNPGSFKIQTDAADWLNESLAGDTNEEAPSRDKIEKRNNFLDTLNAGINLNYFQSALDEHTAATFFADVNVSTKFKLGYIGSPEKLITPEQVREEQAIESNDYEETYTARITELDATEGLSDEDKTGQKTKFEEQRTGYYQKLNTQFAAKIEDIERVKNARNEIFKFFSSIYIEVTPSDVSNLIDTAYSEVGDLVKIAEEAVEKQTEEKIKRMKDDLKATDENIRYSIDKVKSSPDGAELSQLMEELDGINRKYIEDLRQAGTGTAEEDVEEDKKKKDKEDDDESATNAAPEETETALNAAEIISRYNQERNRIVDSIDNVQKSEYATRYYQRFRDTWTRYIELNANEGGISKEKETRLKDLETQLTDQKDIFEEFQDEFIKNLKRIQLKKQLDLLHADNMRKKNAKLRSYKENEKEIFKDLLLEIFKAKKRIIKKFIDDEAVFLDERSADIIDDFNKKFDYEEEQFYNKKQDAEGGDITTIEEEYNQKQELLKNELNSEVKNAEIASRDKVKEYDWQLYLTHLTYLSSEKRRNSMATGIYAKNLGIPVKYQNVKEPLPISVGFDMNYEFLNVENNNSTLYIHYDFNTVALSTIGGGLRYKFLDMVEFRAGMTYNKPAISFATSAAVMFDFGLMNVRLDVGMSFQKIFGNRFIAGLNVNF